MRRLLWFFTCLLTCLGLAAGTAGATGRGSAPTTLVSAPLDGGYQLGSDAAGAASVMWTETRTVGESVDAVIDVRQQGPRGGWGPVRQVGGVTGTSEAQLAVASNGAGVICWTSVQGGRGHVTVVDVATRPNAFAAWSPAKQVWSSPLADGASIATAIDPAGQATVAWAGYDGRANVDPRILTAGVDAATGRVGGVSQAASPGYGGLDPNLAMGADGAAVLSYQRQVSPARRGARSAQVAEMASYRSSTGTWSRPAQLGPSTPVRAVVTGVATSAPASGAPTAAVSADGTAVVVWHPGGAGSSGPLAAATRGVTSGTWGAVRTLSGAAAGAGVEPGPGDSVVAVWVAGTSLLSADSGDGGVWTRPGHIATVAAQSTGPNLAVGASGVVLATPVSGTGSPVGSLVRGANGRWSGFDRVATGSGAQIAAAPQGGATLVWESAGAGGNDTLYARSPG